MNIQGKRIAVTGAAGSLGAAIVRAALDAGAVVAAIDHASSFALDSKNLHEFGGVDLSSSAATEETFNAVGEKLGGLDALVNVAGTFRWEKVEGGKLATWDLLFNVNLRTAVASCMAALPLLKQGQSGRIINIGAAGAVKAGAGMGAYAASKAGVFKLTESLAEELKDQGITVNSILPTTIDTPANRMDMPDADFSRWVKPAQIADVILFLLSDQAQAVTGALIPIAGRT
ncbi:MAG: SDR family oxidoreductase [Proteobacteria bacterium]|uniref:SDR family oxidoreductase n=1 Tax=Rudaea sp. TaxID=2136325 RepID=UPI001D1A7C70|nr:SDR family oxidoreductase [Pseudomonadota bacterium]MBS0567244.1 SDR family oxidoreductase [Pseudomonadota bacterium]